MDLTSCHKLGLQLEQVYSLPTKPVAVKWFERAAEVPEGVLFPVRDLGKHMALCQAVTCARKAGTAVALGKQDHWCWNPLVGFGMVPCRPGDAAFDEVVKVLGIEDRVKARAFLAAFPRLPQDQYEAVAVAPLSDTPFLPDVVLIYGLPGVINRMFLTLKAMTGRNIISVFDGIDSCVYSTVPSFLTGECRVTLPDPGDQERAGAGADEVILTLPAALLDGFAQRIDRSAGFQRPKPPIPPELELDFARPPFYNTLYRLWGLEEGKDWNL